MQDVHQLHTTSSDNLYMNRADITSVRIHTKVAIYLCDIMDTVIYLSILEYTQHIND